MVAWSSLVRNNLLRISNKQNVGGTQIIRHSGDHNVFPMINSSWQWKKFKDMFHYYLLVGAIPLILFATYCNVFIGRAKLAPIPEGYVPKHWEYHAHPITRLIERYCFTNPQQDYEKMLHHIYAADERNKLRKWDQKIKTLIRDRNDYQVWYFRPIDANYTRIEQEIMQDIEDTIASH